MLEELPIYDHVIFLHTHVLVLYVFSPETVIVVEVVHWLDKGDLLWNSLDVLNFSVRFPIEVCHATFSFWLNLEVCNCHLLFENASSFFPTLVTFHTSNHFLRYR